MRQHRSNEASAAPSHTVDGPIGFWILARDHDPTLARINRRTWLRHEPLVQLCVAKGAPSDSSTDLRALKVAYPIPAENLHMRAPITLETKQRLNRFLRAKMSAILHAICASSDEKYSVILDEDTAINVTMLRHWIAAQYQATESPLYAGTCADCSGKRRRRFPIGGGPGLVLSRSAAIKLCAARCVASEDVGSGGGDMFLNRCRIKANVTGTPSPLFSKWPSWSASGETSSYISFHRTKPVDNNWGFGADPRCTILSTGLDGRPMSQQHRCQPYFSLIGTPKSGTTSLFGYMTQHPEFVPSQPKELRAFSPVVAPWKGTNMTQQEYTRLLPMIDPRDFKITGEASPATFYHPAAAQLLARQMRLKVVVLLRHPVERSLSEYANKKTKPHWVSNSTSFGQLLGLVRQPLLDLEPLVRAARRQLQTAWKPLRGADGGQQLQGLHLEGHGGLRPDGAQVAAETAHSATRALVARLIARRNKCASWAKLSGTRARPHCVSPVVYQSWYDLFLPQWLAADVRRTRVLFSDDFFSAPQQALDDITDFLQLRRHAFHTDKIFNSHTARGANTLKTITTNHTNSTKLCAPPDVLAHAMQIMLPSVMTLSLMLRPLGYRVPEAWGQVPKC